MKVTVNTKALLHAVQLVKPTVGRRSALPILQGVKITADPDDGVYVQTTDLEVSTLGFVHGAIIHTEGEGIVPAAMLQELLKSEPTDTLTLETLDGTPYEVEKVDGYDDTGHPIVKQVQVVPQEVTFGLTKMKAMDATDWPAKVDPFDGGVTVEVGQAGGEQLVEAITQVVKSASTDDSRPILTGVYFDREGDQIRLVTTDSYRLAVYDTGVLAGDWNEPVLLPARALKRLPKVTGGIHTFEVDESASYGQLIGSDGIMTLRRIEGTFPSYRQLMDWPDDAELLQVRAPISSWHAALAQLKPIIGKGQQPLRIIVDDDGTPYLKAKANDNERIATLDGVNGMEPGTEFMICFNWGYFHQGISSFGTAKAAGEVTLTAYEPMKPGQLTSDLFGGYTYLLMPVRV